MVDDLKYQTAFKHGFYLFQGEDDDFLLIRKEQFISLEDDDEGLCRLITHDIGHDKGYGYSIVKGSVNEFLARYCHD